MPAECGIYSWLKPLFTSPHPFAVPSSSGFSAVLSMLLRGAVRAVGATSTQACCWCPKAAHQVQLCSLLQLALPQQHLSQQPALAPAAAASVSSQRKDWRCYSNAQASSSSAPESTSGPQKLKYNLRQLNKGKATADVGLSMCMAVAPPHAHASPHASPTCPVQAHSSTTNSPDDGDPRHLTTPAATFPSS